MFSLVRAVLLTFFGAFLCVAGVNAQIAQLSNVDDSSAQLDAPHPDASFDYLVEAFEENEREAEAEHRFGPLFAALLALTDLLDEPAPRACPFVLAEATTLVPKARRLIRPYAPRGPPTFV